MSKATIHIQGVVGKDTKLLDVIRQFKSFQKPSEVDVIINSPGGFVNDGMDIFNYLRKLNLPITTIGKGQVMSIAASIYMAGDERKMEENTVFMIHMPYANQSGNADAFEATARFLRDLENDFTKFYATYLEVDEDTIRKLLQKETFLNANEALQMGIATQVIQPLKAVAMLNSEENNVIKQSNFMSKMTEKLDKIINLLNPTSEKTSLNLKAEIKAEKTKQDSTGVELVFTDLNEGDEVSVGDKATVEGQPANGDYLLADGVTYTFEAGELKEITQPESEDEVEETETPADADEVVAEETEIKAEGEVEETAETENEVDEVTELKEQVATLQNELNEFKEIEKIVDAFESLTVQNKEMKAEITALKKSIGGDFQIDTTTEKESTVKAQSGARRLSIKK